MKFPSPIAAVVGLVLSPLATGMDCPSKDNSIIAHTGTSVGKIETHGGVSMYITGDPKSTSAVLYLTDVFGIQLAENRLLADSFGRAGFLVVAPDLFNATPAPADLTSPGFDTGAFLAKHGPDATDPLIAAGIRYLRGEAGVKTIGVTGYCFGGRYSFRAASKKGLGADGVRADVAFAAHPSLLEDAEITGVGGPASVAAAETDSMMAPDRRLQIQALLQKTGLAYSFALYSGTSHGFGVRANVSDPQQKFGKETAFWQAVRWFETWA